MPVFLSVFATTGKQRTLECLEECKEEMMHSEAMYWTKRFTRQFNTLLKKLTL